MTALLTQFRSSPSRQRGAAQLFITLVLLGVIMMLGITATIISSTQFKLAGNLQFESQAFDNAEAAAASAQSWLTKGCNAQNFAPNNTSYLGLPKSPVVQFDPFGVDWSNGIIVSSDPGKKYVIQYMGPANLGDDNNTTTQLGTALIANQEGKLFRITAQGTSAKGTKRYVQTNLYIKNITGC